MSNAKEMDVKVKFGLKSFITVVALLFAVLIAVGVLTYVIPAGKYQTYTTDIDLANSDPFYVYTTNAELNSSVSVMSCRSSRVVPRPVRRHRSINFLCSASLSRVPT